jgi:hypothetical protein
MGQAPSIEDISCLEKKVIDMPEPIEVISTPEAIKNLEDFLAHLGDDDD